MEGLEETKYAIIKSGVFTGGLYLVRLLKDEFLI